MTSVSTDIKQHSASDSTDIRQHMHQTAAQMPDIRQHMHQTAQTSVRQTSNSADIDPALTSAVTDI